MLKEIEKIKIAGEIQKTKVITESAEKRVAVNQRVATICLLYARCLSVSREDSLYFHDIASFRLLC